ncbi:hypothetical protein HHI36_003108 [Cryptolaemus montrouzieri]|uniref:Uncharacterized protein n=1 Tax=Cryptolaemus montrouzieri TaxID=559131 RepID=A0ABD2PCS2_9CUCU
MKIQKEPIWLTDEVKHSIDEKKKGYHRWLPDKTSVNWQRYEAKYRKAHQRTENQNLGEEVQREVETLQELCTTLGSEDEFDFSDDQDDNYDSDHEPSTGVPNSLDSRINSMKNVPINIIIGQDNWPLLVNRQLVQGPWDGTAMSKTLLGSILHGNIGNQETEKELVCRIGTCDKLKKDDLDNFQDMKRLDRLSLCKLSLDSPSDNTKVLPMLVF